MVARKVDPAPTGAQVVRGAAVNLGGLEDRRGSGRRRGLRGGLPDNPLGGFRIQCGRRGRSGRSEEGSGPHGKRRRARRRKPGSGRLGHRSVTGNPRMPPWDGQGGGPVFRAVVPVLGGQWPPRRRGSRRDRRGGRWCSGWSATGRLGQTTRPAPSLPSGRGRSGPRPGPRRFPCRPGSGPWDRRSGRSPRRAFHR